MRVKGWNSDAKQAFSLYSYPTTAVGLWPVIKDSLFIKFRVGSAFFHVLFAVGTAITKLIIKCGNPDDTMDAFLMIAVGTVVCCKLIVLYTNRDRLSMIINSAFDDWESTEQKSLKIMKSYAKGSTKMAKVYYSAGMTSCVTYLLNVVVFSRIGDSVEGGIFNLTTSRIYTLPGGCIYDDINKYVYYFIVIDQLIQLISCCATNFGSDTMFVGVTSHICGQFEILKLDMMRVGRGKDYNSNREYLGQVIRRHKELMTIAETLEDIYNRIIFMQMLSSVALISVGGMSLLVNLKQDNLMGVIKAIGVMNFMLLQSYIYTYPSDNLANQGMGLMQALYASHWYKLPSSLMKDIHFVMMRINLPPYLTAGKFFYMTRRSYMDVIKTAASYLSVLRIMIE